jgi:hypothetical protein
MNGLLQATGRTGRFEIIKKNRAGHTALLNSWPRIAYRGPRLQFYEPAPATINSDIQGGRINPSRHPLPLSSKQATKRVAKTAAMLLTICMRQRLDLCRYGGGFPIMRGCGAWPRRSQPRLGGFDGGVVSVLKLAARGLAKRALRCLALCVVSKLL